MALPGAIRRTQIQNGPPTLPVPVTVHGRRGPSAGLSPRTRPRSRRNGALRRGRSPFFVDSTTQMPCRRCMPDTVLTKHGGSSRCITARQFEFIRGTWMDASFFSAFPLPTGIRGARGWRICGPHRPPESEQQYGHRQCLAVLRRTGPPRPSASGRPLRIASFRLHALPPPDGPGRAARPSRTRRGSPGERSARAGPPQCGSVRRPQSFFCLYGPAFPPLRPVRTGSGRVLGDTAPEASCAGSHRLAGPCLRRSHSRKDPHRGREIDKRPRHR